MIPSSIVILVIVALLCKNVDALTCHSCDFLTGGPDACETAPIMTCINSTYCLSKYATVDETIWWDGQEYHDIWAHSCAQDLFENDILGNDIHFCQNKGNGCFKQDDFDYDFDEHTTISVTDIYYCCCDSDLCNKNEITTTTNSNSNFTDSTTNSNSNGTDSTTTTAPVDALTCYSCDFFTGPDCQGFNESAPTMTCTNSKYCLSKYSTVSGYVWWDGTENQDIWSHSCAQNLFQDDILGNDILFCQNKGNGCFKQDDFDYDYADTQISVTDIYYCCCDSDLCNKNEMTTTTNSNSNDSTTTNSNSNDSTTTNSNINDSTTTNSNSNDSTTTYSNDSTTTNSNSNDSTTINSNDSTTTTKSPDNGADFIQCSVLAVSAVLMAFLV